MERTRSGLLPDGTELEVVESGAVSSLDSAASKSAHPPFRILVVEHHAQLASGLRQYLEALGHTVEVASSATAAGEALHEREFDVLLSDVWLPEGSCFAFLQELRTRLPRFVVTMSGFELEKEEFRKLNLARGHLVKPFAAERLEELLEEFANERALAGLHDGGGGW